MDFQSSGYCRWGTQSEEGEKIVVHKRATSNAIFAMMATRTLPLRVEQFNTGTTASTSEMSYRSCMVGVEGEWIHPYKAKSVPVTPGVVVANSTIPVFLRAYRAAQTYDGVNNRGFAYGSSVSIYSTAQPIQLLYIKNPTLNNVSGWTAITSNSILERPTTANTITATANTGTILWSSIIPAGQERTFDLAKAIHNVQSDGEIRRLADITASPDTFVWVATSLSGTSTTVTVVPSWHEYR